MDAEERETITQCIEMLSYFEKDNIPKIPESHRISMVINGLRGLLSKQIEPAPNHWDVSKLEAENVELKLQVLELEGAISGFRAANRRTRLDLIEQRAWELYLVPNFVSSQNPRHVMMEAFRIADAFTTYADQCREGQNENEEKQS